MSSTFQSPLAGPHVLLPTFSFPVGLGGQSAEKIFNIVLEWDDLAFVFFKPAASTFVKKKQNWRTAEFALGVPHLCCAPREYLRVHDENVGMKTAAQRLEKCASKNIPTLFEASATSLVWTVFSVPLSSYNSASFALCAVGGDRSKRIRLAGAHVGDSLLHDHPRITITFTGLCPNQKRCDWHWSSHCPFTRWLHRLWLYKREQQARD